MLRPDGAAFYDSRIRSLQYVVSYPASRFCAVIDPVLDYDKKSGTTATVNADRLLDYIRDKNLRPV